MIMRKVLNQRNNQHIATKVLKHLILLVLRMNTMMLCGRYLHQTKGTAMGTPMAVSYANCFMGHFGTNLLRNYKKRFRKEPTLWLKFIDEVFILWSRSEAEFNHFIKFYNDYTSSKGYKSKIKFITSRPSEAAIFLGTKIEVQCNRTLCTDLLCKSTASLQYLQRNSYHPAHVTTSLPKSQLMRIRRICSYIKNYDKHATQFIKHFCRRGYSEAKLKAICKIVRKMSREELLTYRKKDKSNRVTLVLPFHHKFMKDPTGSPEILQQDDNM